MNRELTVSGLISSPTTASNIVIIPTDAGFGTHLTPLLILTMKTVLCWILASAAALTAVTTKLSGNGDGNLMPATSPDSMPGTFQREAGMDIIVFAGDSVGRNQWESLLCMLASGVSNISTIYEVKGKSINKHKGYFSMKFPNFNLTVEYYRTSFLSLLAFPPLTSPSQVQKIIKLDKLHWFSHMWVGAHVLVFNSDHW
ncbi:hypothetical protein K1719_022221 [Acacia pycnantha]|nr:hypothetical protein K1719_022221 [Acacia pycnantha]